MGALRGRAPAEGVAENAAPAVAAGGRLPPFTHRTDDPAASPPPGKRGAEIALQSQGEPNRRFIAAWSFGEKPPIFV